MKSLLKAAVIAMMFNVPSFAQAVKEGSFTTKLQQEKQLGYLLYEPEESKEQKPLIVFLHGSGERGSDLEKVKIHGPFKFLKQHKLDAYVLAPQCPDGQYWDTEALYRLILNVQKQNNIDTGRIYLTGLSMGGWGAWNLAFAHPDMFAALVPIAGFVDRVPMIENCKIKDIPTRIFHGLLDDVVDVSNSIEIYKKLKTCSKDIELTIFDDANHDSWTRVYNNPEIYEWMLKQKKQ